MRASRYGACWCNGDTTTGGHYHVSGAMPKVTEFPQPLSGQTPPARNEREAIFDILVEIRDLLKARESG